MAPPRVLFQLSGSIAAYKACTAISRLAQDGVEVRVAATASALQFVGPATFEGLTARPVATEVFADGSHMDHINLVRWADVLVLCPATANTINKLAAGIGDDLVSTMFLAHRFDKPYIVVPAMNTAMYEHPATQRSLGTLRSWGVEIVEPGGGSLACGEIGAGRLAEPDEILTAIRAHLPGGGGLATSAVRPGVAAGPSAHVVVTSGGTIAPIDGVRAIGNTSRGTTGAVIARHLLEHGHRVTLVHAADAEVPDDQPGLTRVSYATFGELDAALTNAIDGGVDAVIHLAAVSDYDVAEVELDGHRAPPDRSTKLPSGSEMTVYLRPNPKILPGLKRRQAGDLFVIGFKLTNGATEAGVAAAVERVTPGTDLIVHNDLSQITGSSHPATLYRGGEVVGRVGTKHELADALEDAIVAHVGATGDRS